MSSTLIEYLTKTSNQSFEEMAFNEVDGLVLAYAASFLHYTNIKKQGRVSFAAFKNEKGMRQFTSRPAHPDNRQLFKALSQSQRYAEVEMMLPLEVIKPKDKEKFRAVTYQLPNNKRVATFKGSDSSLLSWEENCRMLLKKPLPAVLSAVDYLKETMANSANEYYIAGYSKGGYIASAASFLLPEEVSERILAVYSYDGPGITHIDELAELAETVDFEHHKFIPQESLIGALFEKTENVQVVDSVASGLGQHNPHSWIIKNNQLVRLPELSKKSARLSRFTDHLIAASEETKAIETVDYYFALLKESDIVSIRDFNQMNVETLRRIYRQRQALADKNRGYAPLELIKLFTVLIGKEFKATASSMKARKLEQIKQIKNRWVKEFEKRLLPGTES